MQATNQCNASSSNFSGQQKALFVTVLYIAIMPKELMHLACVFLGATGYLFYLLLHPNAEPYPSTRNQPASKQPENTVVPGTDSAAETTEILGAASSTTPQVLAPIPVEPVAEVGTPLVATALTIDKRAPAAKVSWADVDSSDDESTAVSSDGSHESTSDESIVKPKRFASDESIVTTKTSRLPETNPAPAEENPPKPASKVCCARFQRKKMACEQLEENATQRQKDNQARLAAFKQEMMNPRVKKSQTQDATFKEFDDDAERVRAFRMETSMAGGTTRKKLSVDAAPFVQRVKLSSGAAPFSCSPCVPGKAPSSMEETQEDPEACWQWVTRGFCPRGPTCRWEHPGTQKIQKQTQSYKRTWDYSPTDMFQEQSPSYEAMNHLPTHVAIGFPVVFSEVNGQPTMVQDPASGYTVNFVELNGQSMVQTPVSGQCDTFFMNPTVPASSSSFCDDDRDEILTDDGF